MRQPSLLLLLAAILAVPPAAVLAQAPGPGAAVPVTVAEAWCMPVCQRV